jgi:hypothetical protein
LGDETTASDPDVETAPGGDADGRDHKVPPDIVAIGNSRVILSKSGSAFVVDAGYSKLLPELQRMRAEGRSQCRRNLDHSLP